MVTGWLIYYPPNWEVDAISKYKYLLYAFQYYIFYVLHRDADFEYIQRVHDTRGRYSATLVLLPIVAMKKRGWFPSFMHALKDTGYHHLVEAVAPEFISQGNYDLLSSFVAWGSRLFDVETV